LKTLGILVIGATLGLPGWGLCDDGKISATCMEQEVVREQSMGQPALKGLQRICFSERFVRNQITFGEHESLAIMDLEKQRVVMVPGPEPQYVELPLKDYLRLVTMRLKGTGINDPEAKAGLERTDEEKQVGKWSCRKFVFTQDGRLPIRSELWVAETSQLDFAAWLRLMERLGLTQTLGRIGGFAEQLGGVPILVRTEQTVLDRTLTTTTRILHISLEAMSADQFRAPEGYTRLVTAPIPAAASEQTSPARGD
jgi:hypothetical protein